MSKLPEQIILLIEEYNPKYRNQYNIVIKEWNSWIELSYKYCTNKEESVQMIFVLFNIFRGGSPILIPDLDPLLSNTLRRQYCHKLNYWNIKILK
jgi:hypothetical protein